SFSRSPPRRGERGGKHAPTPPAPRVSQSLRSRASVWSARGFSTAFRRAETFNARAQGKLESSSVSTPCRGKAAVNTLALQTLREVRKRTPVEPRHGVRVDLAPRLDGARTS